MIAFDLNAVKLPCDAVRLYAALYAIGLVVYGVLAWDRVGRQSIAPQFVYQADAWLHGHASVEPTSSDADWARVETVVLKDGREVRGFKLMPPLQGFRPTTRGPDIPLAEIQESRGQTVYVSFPPLPSLLMVPSALLSGRAGNDVIPTLLVAAAILPLALLMLRRLAEARLSQRTLREDLWLVGMLAFGSVLLFSSVQGSVWYTAQVVGVALLLVYTWASIEAKRPVIAGIALAAATLTRTAMAFGVVLFVLEWLRVRGDRRMLIRFVIPLVVFAIPAAIYNYVRFDSVIEFGHKYLVGTRQEIAIEQWGLASYHYLGRNLAAAFTLLPEFGNSQSWLQINGNGLAMWVTTPLLLYVVWPRDKPPIHRALWLTTACVAAPSLLYMNTGWIQFGYRFQLDYLVFLVMLIAIGGRRLGWLAKTLIILGVVINLFGAVTFDRFGWHFYRIGGNAYDCIVPN